MRRRTIAHLSGRGSGSPRLDADLLLAHALGVERLALYTDPERPLTPDELGRARDAVARRARREPVAYITGTRAFRGLDLRTGPEALVPRPETETLVEWALEVAAPGAAALDWGTGGGAVALALAAEGPGLRVTGLDSSEAALGLARENAGRLGADVEWVRSEGLAGLAGRRFGVIAANPPYLTPEELRYGPPELRFEPEGALVAGPTGLEAVEAIAAEAPGHLEPGGWLLVEVGDGQASRARGLLGGAGLVDVAGRADLAGVPRVVGGRRP